MNNQNYSNSKYRIFLNSDLNAIDFIEINGIKRELAELEKEIIRYRHAKENYKKINLLERIKRIFNPLISKQDYILYQKAIEDLEKEREKVSRILFPQKLQDSIKSLEFEYSE